MVLSTPEWPVVSGSGHDTGKRMRVEYARLCEARTERVWVRKFQSGQTQKLRKIESSSRRSALNLMKLTLMRSLAAAAVLFSAAAFAQTTGASPSSSSPLPAAPSAASDPTPAVTTNATG